MVVNSLAGTSLKPGGDALAQPGFFDKASTWCYNWWVMTSNLVQIAPTGFHSDMPIIAVENLPGSRPLGYRLGHGRDGWSSDCRLVVCIVP